MKKTVLILCSLLLSACVYSQKDENKDLNANFGWMHGNCLAIKLENIDTPHQLKLVRLEEKNILDAGVITRKVRLGDECYPLLDDRKDINQAEGFSFYIVESKTPIDMAIGILDRDDLKGLDFEYCATTEGIRYSVLKGRSKIWEGYYYLGYESEATCDSKF